MFGVNKNLRAAKCGVNDFLGQNIFLASLLEQSACALAKRGPPRRLRYFNNVLFFGSEKDISYLNLTLTLVRSLGNGITNVGNYSYSIILKIISNIISSVDLKKK